MKHELFLKDVETEKTVVSEKLDEGEFLSELKAAFEIFYCGVVEIVKNTICLTFPSGQSFEVAVKEKKSTRP